MAEPHGQLMRYKRDGEGRLFFCACAGGAAPAASRFPPDGEAASGGHISFCEERNVEKKVA